MLIHQLIQAIFILRAVFSRSKTSSKNEKQLGDTECEVTFTQVEHTCKVHHKVLVHVPGSFLVTTISYGLEV